MEETINSFCQICKSQNQLSNIFCPTKTEIFQKLRELNPDIITVRKF